MKEWREGNKDYLKEYDRDRYKHNKELIAERKSKPFEGACGAVVNWGNKAHHYKTQKHIINT